MDEKGKRGGMRHVGLAVLAAALYAMSVPLSKGMMESVNAGAMAGLLYLGGGRGHVAAVGRSTATFRAPASSRRWR